MTPAGFVNTLGAYPVEVLAPLIAEGLVRHLEARDSTAGPARKGTPRDPRLDELAAT